MKRLLTIVTSAAALVALSVATPALAKSKQQHRHYGYDQSNRGGTQYGWNGGWHRGGTQYGWNGGWHRADPSFSNQAALRRAQRSGRCVVDLGYGRYEYCGW